MILLIICALAGIKVFVFGAAFPLFNNVDEQQHFDYVWRCGHGNCIAGLEKITQETCLAIATYQSLEYLSTAEECTKMDWQPAWKLSGKKLDDRLLGAYNLRSIVVNIEGIQPPLYYAIAGGWYRLGEILQFSVFWVRFLNVIVMALTVWFSYVFASNLYPERGFLRLGLPMMIASVPQDVFYSISNGVLFALVYGAAFYCLVLICRGQRQSPWFYSVAGLLCAATVLTGYINISIYLVLAIAVVLRIISARKTRTLPAEMRRLSAMLAAAVMPVAAWLIRNYVVLGALTASAQFEKYARWVTKPFLKMFDHPIFTARGVGIFWSELMATYFRGELVWQKETLATPWADAFYIWSPAILLAFTAALLLRAKRQHERLMDIMGFAAILGSVAVLVVLSMRYEFGDWWAPSSAHPYYSHGRLIYGTMIPFFALYLTGLESLLAKLKLQRFRYPALAAICIFMLISEIIISLPVFRSQFNWFHLIG